MISSMITMNDVKILKALLSQDSSISELSRITKITKARVSDSVKRLEKRDFVRKNIVGKNHIYRINNLNSKTSVLIKLINSEKAEKYNSKLENVPNLIDSFLKNSLGEKYKGCLFFGSSTEKEKFNDIDVFIMTNNAQQKGELTKKIKLIDIRLSPIFGTQEELKNGLKEKDMLYQNIARGIQYSCEEFALELLYEDKLLRKKDIQERFILGYREILSCLEFQEKEYAKNHLKKGCMDVIYSILNYFDFSPRNDSEAELLFKEKFKTKIPTTLKDSIKMAKHFGGVLS